MADNTVLNSGSGGDTIATDDIAGVKHQRVKIQYGVDGSATDVSDTNPLPIDDAGGSLTVDGTVTANAGTGTFTVDGSGVTQPVSGTVTANLSATDNAVLDTIETNTDFGTVVGGGLEATALRVTIASDSTGTLSVDDGGSTLSVDGTVTANLGTADVTNAGTFAVQVDGNALTALQLIDNTIKVDDAAFTLASDSVNMAGAIRDDALTTLTAIEGDAVPLRVNSTGALHVTGGGGGTQYNISDVLGATDTVTLAGAVRDDTLGTLTEADGDVTVQRTDSQGATWVKHSGDITIADGGNTISIDDGAGSITVDGTVSVSNLAGTHTDDAAFTPATDDGVPAFAMFDDVTPDSVDEGDAGILRMSANRNLYSTIRDAAGNERGANVNASNEMLVKATDSDALLTTIDADTSTLAAAVSAGQFQVDIAADSTAGLATSALQTTGNTSLSNIETAAQLIDDAVHAEAAALSKGILIALDDGTDAQFAQANASGHLKVDIATDTVGIGGGTQYVEDDAAAANPTGTVPILVRADTPATVTSLDGDNVAQRATNYGAAYVQVVDSSGNFVNSFGGSGGTSHADDAAFSIGSASSITPTGYLADETTPDSVDEGDVGVPRMTLNRKPYAVISDPTSENSAGVDASGHLQVDIAADSTAGLATAANQSTGNTSLSNIETATQLIDDAIYADDADWTDSTSKHMLVGGLYQSVPQTVTDGDVAPLQVDNNGNVIEANSAAILADTANMDTNLGTIAGDTTSLDTKIVTGGGTEAGAVRVTLANDSTGVISIDDGGNTITVDGTVTANAGTGTMTVDLGANNDVQGMVAEGAAVTGTQPFLMAGDDGTNVKHIAVDASGNVQTDVVGALPAGDNNIGNVDIVTLPASTNTIEVVGDAAHDAAVAGNPLLAGFESRTTDGTAVGDGDVVRGMATSLGKQVTYQYAIPAKTWSYASTAAVTDTADDVAQAAGGAGVRNYVTGIQVFNSSDTVGTEVVIKDGSTVIWRGWAEETGGGCSARFDPPLRGTAATAINVANITTSSSTYFNLQGFQSAE